MLHFLLRTLMDILQQLHVYNHKLLCHLEIKKIKYTQENMIENFSLLTSNSI